MGEMASENSQQTDTGSNVFNSITAGDSPWKLEHYPNSYVYTANLVPGVTSHIAIVPLYPQQGIFGSEDSPDYKVEMYTSDCDERLAAGTRDTPKGALDLVEEIADLCESMAGH